VRERERERGVEWEGEWAGQPVCEGGR